MPLEVPPFASQPNLYLSASKGGWSLRFWLVIGLTGIAAGLIGGLLMRLLQAVEHVAWRYHDGTLLEAASRDSNVRHMLVLALAGLLVGVGGQLIRKFMGRPGEVEADIWFHSGRMATLSTLTHAAYSIVTVGMGTSLGRESSIKQAGGAIASRISQWCSLSRGEERLLVACGVGAGMAAAYNVPVGGALFAVEVLLGSLSLRLVLPALICSGVATAASWVLLPTGPIYRVPEFPLSKQLCVWAVLAGPLLGLLTVPLIRTIGWAHARKPKGGLTALLVPVICLAAFGAVSIAFPQLLGNGKDAVALAFADQFNLSLLCVLPALKLLATAVCLGSGASGGLFTPTMTIGALLGVLFGHAFDRVWPGASMGSCSVIGSCAFLAAASEGPLSALVLVLELTRHVDATMVPMLLAVIGAVLVSRSIEPRSIYSIRLHLRSLAHELAKPRQASPLDGLISSDFLAISGATGYSELAALQLARESHSPTYILGHHGRLLGKIERSSIAAPALGALPLEAAKAADLLTPQEPLRSNMTRQQAWNLLQQSSDSEMPVVDESTGRLIGVIQRTSSIDAIDASTITA